MLDSMWAGQRGGDDFLVPTQTDIIYRKGEESRCGGEDDGFAFTFLHLIRWEHPNDYQYVWPQFYA